MHRRPRLSGALLVVLALAGCGDDAIEPAPDAENAACARVLERAPQALLGARRADPGVTGAAAWEGDAGRIVLRCGLDPLGPTTAPCLAVDDVDWVFVADEDPLRFQTFGRTPAVELTVPEDYGREQGPAALADLGGTVRPLTGDGRSCT